MHWGLQMLSLRSHLADHGKCPWIYFWVLNLFTVLAIYSEFAVHWYSNISSTQYETYTRHTQCHQSPGQCFCMEEAMNTVHQCKSLEWCSLLLDVHYLLFIIYLLNLFFWWLLRALRNCSSLYSTVFQSSKLLHCHLDSWGLFWALISWSGQLFGLLRPDA